MFKKKALLLQFFAVLFGLTSYAYDAKDLKRFEAGNVCVKCDLSNVDFKNRELKNADLRQSNLRQANFQGSNLNGADFQGADLSGAKFENASLQQTNFKRTDLSWVRFDMADLQNADLSFSIQIETIFNGSNLEKASLTGAEPTAISHYLTRFEGAVWFNGKICRKRSVGKCIH